MADRRLLIVHAHPDDETITTGALMAGYVRDGVQVTLVTCTLGEEGEILLEDAQHLAADQEDRLGEHRYEELAASMRVLGVTDWRLLGAPHKYRDSGMMGTDSNNRDDCFWRADLLEAASDLVAVIREVRPQVAVTYDDFGGYGHPDHIQAHRVLMYAVSLAAVPSFRLDLGEPWKVSKVYWTALPKGMLRDGIREFVQRLRDNGIAVWAMEEYGMFHVFPILMPWAEASKRVFRVLDRLSRRHVRSDPKARATH